jgi:hypothetical protein
MQQHEASRGVRITLGLILGLVGMSIMIAALRSLVLAVNPLRGSELVGVLMGLCILFAGISVSMRPAQAFPQYLAGALTIRFLALCFDWIAFIPGPRAFHTGSSSLRQGGSVNSSFGRVVSGIVAILMDLFVVHAWRVTIRFLTTKPG